VKRSGIRYAQSGDVDIAYEVAGDGPLDIVFAFDWVSHLDIVWEHPQNERFLRRFTNYGRLIAFDMRGSGLSDPVQSHPSPEEWMDDVRAVMEAAGSERAALVGHGSAGQMCALFAASHPERTQALVTINSYARLARAPDYLWGLPPKAQQSVLTMIETAWGTGAPMLTMAPAEFRDDRLQGYLARLERTAGGPRRAAGKQRLIFDIDVRDVLPAVTVPTLVTQNSGNPLVRPEHGRYLAEHIPGARYLELPGDGHWLWVTDDAEPLMDTIEEFLTGARRTPEPDRVLTTVAFTDIVGSTELAARLGDRRWRDLLEVHDSVARREVAAGRGSVIKSTGDGLVATFDGPARAVRSVVAIERQVEPLGMRVRGGVHTGEVELREDDIGGIAVHAAARVAALAGPSEVLVSSTVRDLVVGSGLEFEDRGLHALKGVPGEWRLFAVEPGSA
jgi:class 3 adenylate cyclase